MAQNLSRLITQLSRADLERMLAAKEQLEELEMRRTELQRELADVEKRLARLQSDVARGREVGGPRKKAVKKARKKVAKKVAKKATRKASKKAARKAAPRARGRVHLEDVVVTVITDHGGQMTFKELLAAIVEGKLFESRSKSFDNVLRRTLSISKRVKRVGRGVYAV